MEELIIETQCFCFPLYTFCEIRQNAQFGTSFCTELPLFCIALTEYCISFNQSERRSFSCICIISSEIIRVISKSNEREARVRFEFISTKNARLEVQLPLYQIQFEITQFNGQVCQTMAFCHSFSCNVIGQFKKALESDRLFCFTVPCSLAEKKMRFRAKDSAIRE